MKYLLPLIATIICSCATTMPQNPDKLITMINEEIHPHSFSGTFFAKTGVSDRWGGYNSYKHYVGEYNDLAVKKDGNALVLYRTGTGSFVCEYEYKGKEKLPIGSFTTKEIRLPFTKKLEEEIKYFIELKKGK